MSHRSSTTKALRSLLLATTSILLVLVPVASVSAAPAEPAAPTAPPVVTVKPVAVKVDRVHDMVHAKKHLFVSAGDEVRVLKENGKLRKRLKKLPGAQGMVLDAKGDRLYVALRDADTIVSIDTRRLEVVKRFKVGQCPTELALAGGRLFYARDECDAPETSIESIDPRRGGVPVPSGILAVPEPMLLVGGGDTLVMSNRASSSAAFTSFHVSGARATLQSILPQDGYVYDLAISPDGETVYVPDNHGGQVRAVPTATMRGSDGYPTGAFFRSLAVSRDGRRIAAGIDASGPDLFAFEVGREVPTLRGSTVWPGGSRPGVFVGSLTFSDDGKKVFELMGDSWEGPTYLVSARTVPRPTS